MERVEKRDRATLLPIILRHIAPGSTIMSDKWKPYEILNQEGYSHFTVNHSETFVAEDGTCTNNIERIWGELKAELKIMRGTNDALLAGHMDEFMFRKMHKGMDIFECMLTYIAQQYPC